MWAHRYAVGGYSLRDKLLQALVAALQIQAAKEPDDFLLNEQDLRSSNLETAEYLLLRSYSANPSRFAQSAADFLCQQPE